MTRVFKGLEVVKGSEAVHQLEHFPVGVCHASLWERTHSKCYRGGKQKFNVTESEFFCVVSFVLKTHSVRLDLIRSVDLGLLQTDVPPITSLTTTAKLANLL